MLPKSCYDFLRRTYHNTHKLLHIRRWAGFKKDNFDFVINRTSKLNPDLVYCQVTLQYLSYNRSLFEVFL